MDMQQSNVIAGAAFSRQARIAEEDRCPSCDGLGQLNMGCAITHNIWKTCLACGGTGLLADVPEFLRKRVQR